ncbi:MAG: MarR family transcriptional regulator [Halobacteria archaeon]|nr:MarR family transcriptional regulator [Halobacteria archaeon]
MSTAQSELGDDEEAALDLIVEEGEIHQSELWKELDIGSRKASRILSSLEEEDLIRREEVAYEGNRTYLIRPKNQSRDYSLLVAGEMLSPFVGTDDIDPIESDAFTQWILELSAEMENTREG